MVMVHLIDGTYELFRAYFGAPSAKGPEGKEVGATRVLVRSLASWLRTGALTHVACAFDSVIESFRNDLFPGYKTGKGIDPDLYAQFELAERAVRALGLKVWPMVEFEADDALATGASLYSRSRRVTKVLLCTPDKDLAQSVRGDRVVTWDRHRDLELDEAGIMGKFGVSPGSIPDLLALVGDAADGIPGIARWGSKSAATVLKAYGNLEAIPKAAHLWQVKVRGAEVLSQNLNNQFTEALLYRQLATLRDDVPITDSLDEIKWQGADREALASIANELGDRSLMDRINSWRS